MTQELVTTERSDGQVGVEALILKGIENNLPVESLERLLAMRNQLKAEAAREAYIDAMSAFQAAVPIIPKTKTATVETQSGGRFTYKYAPLEAIVDATQELRRTHGFSYKFDTRFEADPPAQVVTCYVQHRDGHVESSEFRTPIDVKARMNVMQQSASALTYAKRYSYLNAFGIVTGDDDDDGRASGSPPPRTPVPTAARRPPPPDPTPAAPLVEGDSRQPMTLAQQIAMVCREITVDRADLIRALTGKTSGRDLTREEAQAVLDTARAIQRGEKRLVEVADVWQVLDVVTDDEEPPLPEDDDADAFFAGLQERP